MAMLLRSAPEHPFGGHCEVATPVDEFVQEEFKERRLGLKLVLAMSGKSPRPLAMHGFKRGSARGIVWSLGGRAIVVVEETIVGVCPPSVCPRDELAAVDGTATGAVTAATFADFVSRLARRPRPLALTFRRGAGRASAVAAQARRVARSQSRAALEDYERREDDGRAAFNASLLRANGLGGGARDTAAAVRVPPSRDAPWGSDAFA